jgi:serine/threonine protein kinase
MTPGCPDPERLRRFALGKVPEDVIDEISHHLEQCATCDDTIASLEMEPDTLLSRLRGPLPPNPVSDEPEYREALALLKELDIRPPDARPFPEESPARQIGDYRLVEELGEGGMGVVWKAEHRRMRRWVAVKMISPAALTSPDAVDRFYREAQAAAKLSHPHIITAYDAGEHEGTHYLVMEYVEGEDLARVVKRRGPLPVRDAVAFTLQAARGLAYAHSQGIVHRDIKPGNLLVSRQGQVKILDMGLARIDPVALADDQAAERLTRSGQMMGTCEYMAPEQAWDTHSADGRL